MISPAPERTARAGALLGGLLGPGDVVALAGELGAGKTVFSKGVAAGLGIEPRGVRSATFTLLERYEGGRCPLVHLDAYRLSGPEDLVAIGLDEALDPSAVAVVEWAPRVLAALPEERLDVALEHPAPGSTAGPSTRRIAARGRGARPAEIVRSWRRLLLEEGFGAGE